MNGMLEQHINLSSKDFIKEYYGGKEPNSFSLTDYINLCAEEHYWYKKGHIDEKVWKAWSLGMKEWYLKIEALKSLWEVESKNKAAYYLDEYEDLFNL